MIQMERIVRQLIENNTRDNVIYYDSAVSAEKLAKLIAGFANNNGGYIILGVYDDGLNLYIKNYLFNINEGAIENFLCKKLSYKIEYIKLDDKKLIFISIEASSNLIKIENIAYFINGNGVLDEIVEKTIFLSYTHNESNIASIIENGLVDKCGKFIKISRDINRLRYKDSIREYMETIKKHDFVLTIISDKYLKSRACMFEVLELMRDREYYEKLLFTIVSEKDEQDYFTENELPVKPEVYGTGRFNYISYWQSELQKLKELDSSIINPAHKAELVDEIRETELIAIHIGEFLKKLKDGIGTSISNLVETEFQEFYEIIIDF